MKVQSRLAWWRRISPLFLLRPSHLRAVPGADPFSADLVQVPSTCWTRGLPLSHNRESGKTV